MVWYTISRKTDQYKLTLLSSGGHRRTGLMLKVLWMASLVAMLIAKEFRCKLFKRLSGKFWRILKSNTFTKDHLWIFWHFCKIVDHSISFMADTLAVFLNWCPQLDSIVVLVFVVKFWLSLTNTIRSKSKYQLMVRRAGLSTPHLILCYLRNPPTHGTPWRHTMTPGYWLPSNDHTGDYFN